MDELDKKFSFTTNFSNNLCLWELNRIRCWNYHDKTSCEGFAKSTDKKNKWKNIFHHNNRKDYIDLRKDYMVMVFNKK